MTEFQQLHIILKKQSHNKVLLRYVSDEDALNFEDRILDLAAIEAQVKEAQKNYYAYMPADLMKTGQAFYNWLDGENRFLERAIQHFPADQLLVLAFQGEGELLHLPWELLHNGKEYLIQQMGREIVPIRLEPGKATARTPEKRALEVLFMATAPRDVQPELDFEQEEDRILEETERLPINLEVEESGNLQELHQLLIDMGETKVDAVHISGHAANLPTPHFLTEDAHGNLHRAEVKDFKACFNSYKPSLLFLSGCETGGATEQGGVPSLAEALVKMTFPAVLAWAKPVRDITATKAASHLYHALSEGQSLPKALYGALNALLSDEKRQYPDWHLLRLYAFGNVPVNLIQSGKHGKRPQPIDKAFLDAKKEVSVPGRRTFVGRRRVIQDCLKVLRDPNNVYMGIVLHGMGGLGKSSIAYRISQRLNFFYDCKVLVGVLDEMVLLNTLGFNQKQPIEHLKDKFSSIFRSHRNDNPGKRLLIVLDDFEQNFEEEDGKPKVYDDRKPRLKADEVRVLTSLLEAINTYACDDQPPQLFITSRYTFELTGTANMPGTSALKFTALNGFEKGEWHRFKQRQKTAGHSKELVARSEEVANGNPRLLEWLLEVLENGKGIDYDELLKRLDSKEQEFREDLLAEYLYSQQDKKTKKLLQALTLFELPISAEDLGEYTGLPSVDVQLQKVAGLSLVEVYGDSPTRYRFPRVLRRLFDEPSKQEFFKASYFLGKLWQGLNPHPELNLREISRLGILGGNEEVLLRYSVPYLQTLRESERHLEVLALGREILDLIPDNLAVLLSLGVAYQFIGELTLSESSLSKGLRLSVGSTSHREFLKATSMLEMRKGRFDAAIKKYQQLLDVLNASNLSEKSYLLFQIGACFGRKGEFNTAIDYLSKSQELAERCKDEKRGAAALHEIGSIHFDKRDYKNALVFFEKALDIKVRIGDEIGVSDTMYQMASSYKQLKELDKAIGVFLKCLERDELVGNLPGKQLTLKQLQQAYFENAEELRLNGKLNEAITFYERCEKIGVIKSEPATIGHSGLMRALVLSQQKKHETAWFLSMVAMNQSMEAKSDQIEVFGRIQMRILYDWISDLLGDDGISMYTKLQKDNPLKATNWLKTQGMNV